MDINAIHGENINPVENQKQVQATEQHRAEHRVGPGVDKTDDSNVSPEALRVAELVERVEAQNEIREELVQEVVNSVEAGAYDDPDVLNRTSSNMLELM